jgi:hypothetical protein
MSRPFHQNPNQKPRTFFNRIFGMKKGGTRLRPALKGKESVVSATGRVFCYIPKTALNQFLIISIGPLSTMALIRQATAQRPTRPEATPMVMILLRDTESTAVLLDSVTLLLVLIVVVMSVLLGCVF